MKKKPGSSYCHIYVAFVSNKNQILIHNVDCIIIQDMLSLIESTEAYAKLVEWPYISQIFAQLSSRLRSMRCMLFDLTNSCGSKNAIPITTTFDN